METHPNFMHMLKEEVYPIYRKFLTSESSPNVILSDLQIQLFKNYVSVLSQIYGKKAIPETVNRELDLNNFVSIFEIMEHDLEFVCVM